MSLLFAGSGALAATRPGGTGSSKTCDQSLGEQPQQLPKIDPIILKPLDRLPESPKYQFEMKYDGFRAVGYFEQGRGCRFISRKQNHLAQFQDLCDVISKDLDVQSAIFDGEVIAPDHAGRPVFKNMLRRQGPFQYVAFDLLWLNGQDLRSLPLESRRQRLLEVLPKSSPWITESLAVVGSGSRLYDLMVENDLEGIVVKRLSDKYARSTKWYKFKNRDYSQAKGRARFFK